MGKEQIEPNPELTQMLDLTVGTLNQFLEPYCIRQKKVNLMSNMKIILDGINGILDIVKEKISEFEDTAMKTIPSESQILKKEY